MNGHFVRCSRATFVAVTLLVIAHSSLLAEELPPVGAAYAREQEFYKLVDLPIPETTNLEAGSILPLDKKRLAIGTRRGDIYIVDGALEEEPAPVFRLYASGLHEVLGLAQRDGDLFATQQCEVTRLRDLDGDGRADRFETVSDGWGFGGEHEFTYGSRFDKDGYIWTVHCLTGSYTSEHLFRGWCLRIAPDGETIPTCSGVRSPGGIGMNATGDVFYTENQGPWNGTLALKHLKPRHFMGHPISFRWYPNAPNMGPRPDEPKGGREHRQHIEALRIPQLVPPAVVFPYKKMGQSASAICLDTSAGKFGPFPGQLFVADYTLSLLMRVGLEQVEGVYQGACFPFREGFQTGLIGATLTADGYFVAGGCSRGWPTRGVQPYALQRLQWTGKMPFEIHSVKVRRDGFELAFTTAVDVNVAKRPESYRLSSYTHFYQPGYGSPEVDHTEPLVERVDLLDERTVRLTVDGLRVGHVHQLHLPEFRSVTGESLLHDVAYYTLNRLPE